MNSRIGWTLGIAALAAAAYVWRSARGASETARAESESDRIVNEASEESFPASDAPSHTPTLGSLAAGR